MADETKQRVATVKTLAVQGKGKKIHKNGDQVTPSSFHDGHFDSLIKSGHIVEGKPQPVEPTIESEKEKAKAAHLLALKEERDGATKLATELGVQVTDEMTTEDITAAISAKNAEAEAEVEAEAKLAEAKKTCDKYEIAYAEDADIDTLNQLIADYEADNSKSFVNAKGETIVVKSIDDITKAELEAELKKADVVFQANEKKPALYAKWIELK